MTTTTQQGRMTPARSPRNWIGMICDDLVSSGTLSTRDAAQYLTDILFGEIPNPYFHESRTPHEALSFFLRTIYRPIVEAAFRDLNTPQAATFHVFTDVSLLGNSAVLIVYFPPDGQPSRLVTLEAIRPWNFTFHNVHAFHEWAQGRYNAIVKILREIIDGTLPKEGIAEAPFREEEEALPGL